MDAVANSWGTCDPRFAAVRDAFEGNFADGLEVGAACAVTIDGQILVDLWGGATFSTGPAWAQDTMVEIRSATKGVAAICLHVLVDRGLVDLDAPVRRYWPELRADPTVRQVLTHEAGIPVIDAALPPNALTNWDVMAEAVAIQEPLWEPGERHGYHGVTFGWLVGQIVRSVTGDLIGPFLRDEVAGPLGAACFIGTPVSEHHRIAPLVVAPKSPDGIERPSLPQPDPASLMARMFAPVFPPISPQWNSAEFWSADIPVTNCICTARGLAQVYGELGAGGGSLVSRSTVDEMGIERVAGVDAVLEVDVRRALGFELRPSYAHDARPDTAFGHPGASGFLGFADPAAGIGFAYVKNAGWGGKPGTDTRAGRLIDALYGSL